MSSFGHTIPRGLVLVLAALLLPAPVAGAPDDSGDVEELRKEVKALRSQIQALRAAMAEAAELDRQRAAALSKALKTGGEPAAATARTEREVQAPRPPEPVAAVEAPAPAPAHARRRATVEQPAPAPAPAPPPQAPGVVRGKVDVPAGEPVAYVFVENVLEPAVRGRKVVIQQVGKKFMPGWAVVQRGTAIEFPNMDNIYHNVFSLSSGNTFDLGLYNSGGEAKTHTFTEAGAVDIYCNIHPQMAASTLVVPNRHFAKVKPDGSFEIAGVPRGRRKVVAWSPGSRLNAQWVDLAGASADVTFTLEPKSGGHKNKQGRAYGSYE